MMYLQQFAVKILSCILVCKCGTKVDEGGTTYLDRLRQDTICIYNVSQRDSACVTVCKLVIPGPQLLRTC